MSLERINAASRIVIDHIVDNHPEIDDDVYVLAWIDRKARRIVCEACTASPAETLFDFA